MLRYIYFSLLILFCCDAHAQLADPVLVRPSNESVRVDSGIQYLEDASHTTTIENVINNNNFKVIPPGTPNLGITRSAYWIKLHVKNETNSAKLVLRLANPGLDSVELYEPVNSHMHVVKTGQCVPFEQREYLSSDYLFGITIAKNEDKLLYLKISSAEALLLPITIGTETKIFDADKYKDIFWGMYIGLMVAMLLYNFFVYLTTKDNSYLYYIAYVLAVLITQITLSGYAFQLVWPGNVRIAEYSVFLTPVLVGIAGIEFMRHFLKTKHFLPKLDKGFIVVLGLYVTGGVISGSGNYSLGLNLIDMTASLAAFYMLFIAILITRRGYRPASFFLISWIVFLIGIFVFVFKNLGILPYNNFTVYTMPVGSAMEVLLLSFALADRINILKKEKEASQAEVLSAVKENERIVREQNVILEGKVNERTYELKLSNDDLNKAMTELKDAQSQLVESEKMASLGQLTAGIAHEINNPINFVTSNVKPLNRDVLILLEAIDTMEKINAEEATSESRIRHIEEYKTEIDYDYLKMEIDQLLKGISDGASRTAEIVKGLRVFSRLDEDDLKKADINEGLDSTLVITNNMMGTSIKLVKNYANLPLVECYPGKLNQVFLNIISNAIYAIKKKHNGHDGGLLTISTTYDDQNVYIKLADNGIGMDEGTKKRLFEPFFTTKEVGEGTGLGLSISYNTIHKHNGQIQVNSEPGVGTEFILILPLLQK